MRRHAILVAVVMLIVSAVVLPGCGSRGGLKSYEPKSQTPAHAYYRECIRHYTDQASAGMNLNPIGNIIRLRKQRRALEECKRKYYSQQ